MSAAHACALVVLAVASSSCRIVVVESRPAHPVELTSAQVPAPARDPRPSNVPVRPMPGFRPSYNAAPAERVR